MPLWHSAFFRKLVKSRVHENQYCTFYCPRLLAEGIRRVGDCVSSTGQLRVDLIQQISQSYRSLCMCVC